MLIDTNNYELVTPVLNKDKTIRTTCSFVVGQKNCLNNATGYMNSSSTNSGSWNDCARRSWCNSAYPAALPVSFIPAFKRFKVNTIKNQNSTTMKTSEDLFALFAEKEIFGSRTYSNSTEESKLSQIEYYKDSSNRIKKAGDDGMVTIWWERSPRYNYSDQFCSVSSSGTATRGKANNGYGLAPFGVI